LRQCPYAVEAVLALVELGLNWSDLQALYAHSPTTDVNWIQQLVHAHRATSAHEHKNAIVQFLALHEMYPTNLHALNWLANCYAQMGEVDMAHQTFSKLRRIDGKYMDSMDAYASIMKGKGQTADLNRLSQELVRINPHRPETWTTVAIYLDVKGQKQKAIGYVDRAIQLDERHAFAYLIKGALLLGLNLNKEAAAVYRKAYALKKDLPSMQGLVRACLAMADYREALAVAKEAYHLMPNNPKALTLYGVVLSHLPQARETARKALNKALSIDNSCLDSVRALAQLNVMEAKHQQALGLLEKYLAVHDSEALHTLMGDVLANLERYDEAMNHYQKALHLSPGCAPAKAGMERLEKLLRRDTADDSGSENENENGNENEFVGNVQEEEEDGDGEESLQPNDDPSFQ
jgi:anaphase-promoting complex subunit 7